MTRGNSTKNKPQTTPAPAVELVNPGTSGIVYDEDGHSVGGGQRVTLAGDPDRVAMRQLEVGNLLAQRGDTWLQVRDGQLVDPHRSEDTSADTPDTDTNEQKTAVGASTTTPAVEAATIRRE